MSNLLVAPVLDLSDVHHLTRMRRDVVRFIEDGVYCEDQDGRQRRALWLITLLVAGQRGAGLKIIDRPMPSSRFTDDLPKMPMAFEFGAQDLLLRVSNLPDPILLVAWCDERIEILHAVGCLLPPNGVRNAQRRATSVLLPLLDDLLTHAGAA